MEPNNTPTPGVQPEVNTKPSALAGFQAPSMMEILTTCAHYWYWFAICLVAFVAIAYVQYKRTAPVYQRTAMIQIVKADGSTQTSDASTLFVSLGMNQNNTEKMAEKLIISSPPVMDRVVRDLKLNINYTVPGFWHPETLYGANLPFNVTFPDFDDEATCDITTRIEPKGMLTVTSISGKTPDGRVANIPDLDLKVDYSSQTTVNTPIGHIVFSANPIYDGGPIEEPYTINVKRSSIYWTALNLTNSVVTDVPDVYAEMLTIAKSDVVPERARDIVNAVINAYNEQWANERQKVAETTSNFINERLNGIAEQLSSVESDIASYKSSHLVADPVSMSSTLYDKANRAQEHVMELNNQLVMASYVRDFMTNSANANEVLPSNAGVGSVNIESQISRYNELVMERNRLAANSSSSNPIVLDYDSQLSALRSALVKSLDNAIALYRQQISSAQHNESLATSRIASSPTQAHHLLSQERKQKVIESLYVFLMQKREENELTQKNISQRVRIIAPPVGSPDPVSPNRNMILLIAAALGLLLPFGVIYMREMLDNKVRTRHDVEALSVPFLGELPDIADRVTRMRRHLPGNRRIVPNAIHVEPDNVDVLNEAFRMLRTKLDLMVRPQRVPGRAFTLSVTSINPNSGKTFVAMNLGAVLAIKGHRVLLLDMDLRRTTMSDSLGYGSKRSHSVHGLVDCLVGADGVTAENIVVRDVNGVANLDLVPCGVIPPNPSEILSEANVDQLIEYYKDQYDYIIFDCPPMEMVADTLILNKYADMTCFIMRAGMFNKSLIPVVEGIFKSGRYNQMAIILNATQGRPGYSYRYGYGYGYSNGYGYRYGYNKKKKKVTT